MRWTLEARQAAMIAAPTSGAMLRDDSQVIARPGWYQIITPSAPASYNEVVHSALAPGEVDRAIAEVEATYGGQGLACKWLIEPSTRPLDLAARLEARGWSGWDIRGMAVDPALDLGPSGAREIAEPELDEYLAVLLGGWQLPAEQAALEAATHRRELAAPRRRAHFFAAFAPDGRIAGTAGLILHADFAYLVGGQVLPAERGRGLYRQLVAARLAFLRRRGLGLAVTYAREATSAPMLEHLGFETLFRSRCTRLLP